MFENPLFPRRRASANVPSVFGGLQNDINRLFDDFWGDVERPAPVQGSFVSPRIDVRETEEAYLISAEMPGASEDDLDVQVSDGVLSIKGEKKQEAERDEAQYHVRERSYGSFQRQFRLPPTVDAEKIIGKFENGVLNVVIPKLAEAKTQTRRIAIDKP